MLLEAVQRSTAKEVLEYMAHRSSFAVFGLAWSLLLDDVLVETVDDGDGQQDTSSGSNGSQEIGENGQETGEDTTQSGCGFDELPDLPVGALVSIAFEAHSLFLEVVANFFWALAGDADPGFAEKGTALIRWKLLPTTKRM